MFKIFRESSSLELEVERALRELKHHPIGSEEYVKTLDSIVVLHRMQEEENPGSVSKDTLAIIAANLLGILLIINHERVDIASRTAMSLILKPRT